MKSVGPIDVWLMAVAFGLQIYFDFSSYTRMATRFGQVVRHSIGREFQLSLFGGEPGRFLESLAHVALAVDSRLPVFPTGRKPTDAPIDAAKRRSWR